jgi:valyl-tRNA synthetase
MKQELNKVYNPTEHEDKIYQKWEESGFFNPDNLDLPASAPAYTIVLPPPNITDKLHMGHTVMVAVEDLLIRYHRLAGFRTLWVPGTDHAAIATQNVVEKNLLRASGQTRHDLGREKFLQEVWKFLEVTQGEILHQIKKLGASLDWSRLAFTLDEPRQVAVRQMFKEMYEEGAIYRGERIVNWCPRCQSTLADDEVEYKEQLAKIYTFKYDQDFPIAISTTRPETKLGDVAVAVNPKDERYKKYIGQTYTVNFCGQALQIKIIADRNVDINFGTGALGVTPAHSLVDWQMAQTNNLPVIKVIDENGQIYPGFGKFSGLTVAAARLAVVEELKQQNLLLKEEDFTNNLSVCYRCGTAIEPLVSRQWFIAVDKPLPRLGGQSLKVKAVEAATSGQIKFYPERFNKRYCDWMNNLHDWCISRQIWFGHQIPVWYRGQEIYVDTVPPTGEGWQQDPDTLDTWFSSGMWTFSTLGWPTNFKDGKKINDLAKFHPTQVLETGYEIITLWVSRMIMMSLFAVGEIPFSQVYLHGLILDQDGKKMSKSKGNGVDPLDVIANFGADAARLSILMDATPGNDSRFSEAKVEAKRNFINKFWNISRFVLTSASEEIIAQSATAQPAAKTLADKWILAELAKLIAATTRRLDNLELALAAEDLYDFTWNKFADWYLEISKIEKDKEEILLDVLRNLLILWHPFIPYVTETVWSSFNDSLLMVAPWPVAEAAVEDDSSLAIIQDIIVAIRNARSVNKIEPAQKLTALIYGHEQTDLLLSEQALIMNLRTGLSSVDIQEQGVAPERAIAVIVGPVEIYLLGAVDEVKERERLSREQEKLEKLITNQTQKLANADFVGRAPAAIVAAEQTKLAAYQAELAKIVKIISSL